MGDNIKFEDFLNEVSMDLTEFISQTHDFLLESGCKIEIKLAKSGYVVSYSYNKRVLLNYVFRKSGMLIRIYGAFAHNYAGFLETLPEKMIKAIEEAPVCKRLIDPAACNSKCKMGYDFYLKGSRLQKCQYSCFMFKIDGESARHIRLFLENELNERKAG